MSRPFRWMLWVSLAPGVLGGFVASPWSPVPERARTLACFVAGVVYLVLMIAARSLVRAVAAWHQRRRLRLLWRRVEAEALGGMPPAERKAYPPRPPQPDRRH